MIRVRERNLRRVGVISIVVIAALIVGSLEFAKLPLIHRAQHLSADFADAGGLATGDVVTIHGVKVGTITGLALQGASVRVSFDVREGLALGAATVAAAQVLSPIGTEYLQLDPAGPGRLSGTIPTSRTRLPSTLVTDLSTLGSQIQHYDVPALQRALQASGAAVSQTPASDVEHAFSGLARLSRTIGAEGSSLATIVSQGAGLTQVLADRSSQLTDLVGQGAIVLQVLQQRKAALDQLLKGTAALGAQITALVGSNQAALAPLLSSLQTVSGVLSADSKDIGAALPVLAAFSRYAANTTGSGPYADVAVPTLLLPDNVLVQCNAAGTRPSTNPAVGCRP